MPLLTVTAVVLPPAKMAPVGPLEMAMLRLDVVSPTSTLPNESSILAVTCGLTATPAVVLLDCWPNTICVAAAGLTRMSFESTDATPPALAVKAMFIVSATL